MIYLTEDEFAELFIDYPQVRVDSGSPLCPHCSNPFSPENLDYYNSCTEYGTECCAIEIKCDVCGHVIWRGGAWGWVEDKSHLIDMTRDMLEGSIPNGPEQPPQW